MAKQVYLLSMLSMLCLVSAKDVVADAGVEAEDDKRLQICGHYCGPDWCNNQNLDEARCDQSMRPQTWLITGPSCADSCCRSHDRCCGHGADRSICNREIVECLGRCNSRSLTCTRGSIPVPAGTIRAAMRIAINWCCGGPCPGREKELPDYIGVGDSQTFPTDGGEHGGYGEDGGY
mmetsp:Transcript_709/g.830  ORF Transcript_709/g.830 Transcript_709/m.830 type:complete len:177 (-) Transcript_709:315-845(-)